MMMTVLCFQSDGEASWMEKTSEQSKARPVVGPCLQVGEVLCVCQHQFSQCPLLISMAPIQQAAQHYFSRYVPRIYIICLGHIL